MIPRNPCFHHCMILFSQKNGIMPGTWWTLKQRYVSFKEWLRGEKTAIRKWTQTWKIRVEKQKQYLKDSLNHQLKLYSIIGSVWKTAAIRCYRRCNVSFGVKTSGCLWIWKAEDGNSISSEKELQMLIRKLFPTFSQFGKDWCCTDRTLKAPGYF